MPLQIPYCQYRFVSVWELPFPLEKIWNEIADPEDWPTWWKGLKEAKVLQPGDPSGLGLQVAFAWKSLFPYTLHLTTATTEIVPRKMIRGTSQGDLIGTGTWQFEERGEICQITYIWEVQTSKAWMNFLAPIGRPFFSLAHNHLMGQGEKGLQKLLSMKA